MLLEGVKHLTIEKVNTGSESQGPKARSARGIDFLAFAIHWI